MRGSARVFASAAGGVLVLLCISVAVAQGQSASAEIVTHLASLAPGSINGTVHDETGLPVPGATVSALGATMAFAITDRSGRFELRTLSPGPYLVRAHSSGFVASRGELVDVRPSARALSSIALRHAALSTTTPSTIPTLAAGFGSAGGGSASQPAGPDASSGSSSVSDDHGEVAWRLRHARRGILKNVVVPDDILHGDTPTAPNVMHSSGFWGKSTAIVRSAPSLFANTPFSGQLNLL